MKIFVLCALSLGWLTLGTSEAVACLCKPESPDHAIKRLRKESTAIFVGSVKEITKIKAGYKVTLVVEKLWKGKQIEEITVHTEGGCMAWFEVGRQYLVYAVKDRANNFQTNVCMRTGLTKYSSKDFKKLGQPKFTNKVGFCVKPRKGLEVIGRFWLMRGILLNGE